MGDTGGMRVVRGKVNTFRMLSFGESEVDFTWYCFYTRDRFVSMSFVGRHFASCKRTVGAGGFGFGDSLSVAGAGVGGV